MGLLDHVPGWSGRRSAGPHQTFPEYSTLPTTPNTAADTSSIEDNELSYASSEGPIVRPSLSRFFADFTLGFADGLTVPFALTAGLSSLGYTNTVIYAGMAEICAGCISMGIGGYLAAKGEQRQDSGHGTCQDGKLNDTGNEDREKAPSSPPSPILEPRTRQNIEVDRYLATLQLPPDLLQSVIAHIESTPGVANRIHEGPDRPMSEPQHQPPKTPPALSGLSVALGYLLGGLLPLAPYFFVSSITSGLIWSFAICITALFLFGLTKECALRLAPPCQRWDSTRGRSRKLRWDVIKHGLWEGLRMVVFGGIAAVAAVLCVRLFEGLVS